MEAWAWQFTPFISVLRKQRQVDLCEFEVSLVHTERLSQNKTIKIGVECKSVDKYLLFKLILLFQAVH